MSNQNTPQSTTEPTAALNKVSISNFVDQPPSSSPSSSSLDPNLDLLNTINHTSTVNTNITTDTNENDKNEQVSDDETPQINLFSPTKHDTVNSLFLMYKELFV
jgi:hypothetical protein